MKSDKSEIFSIMLLFLSIFSFTGWYLAQQDNELLRQELETQNNTKPVHYLDHEGKQHD